MIYYFTGTGNSRYIARELHQQLNEDYISVNTLIRNNDHSLQNIQGTLVFVVPTYAWRIPRIVEEWIRLTAFKDVEEVYFVMDCGGNIGNAGYYNRKLCEKKGFNYRGTMEIIMPENYLAMFNTPEDDEAKKIVKQADPIIKEAVSYIHQHLPFPNMSLQLKDKFQSSIVNTVFYPLFVKAAAFYSTDECIGCGLCEKLCPLKNIQIKDHRPVWGKECTHCMACIAKCPKKAIEYGKKSKGKNRYYID